MRVGDCAGGCFDVKVSKTPAGVREFPIHTDLAAIVEARSKGKPAEAFLIHEAGGVPKTGRDRGMAASKRFGYFRKRQGVHEAVEGSQQSRVDFHSLRRWFITAALNAGVARETVAAVVGHEAGNITADVYSGGPSDDRKRACVEAVRLPKAERRCVGSVHSSPIT
jgi:integrase